jgi:hypothetical protein
MTRTAMRELFARSSASWPSWTMFMKPERGWPEGGNSRPEQVLSASPTCFSFMAAYPSVW